jgi:hypothetical protein
MVDIGPLSGLPALGFMGGDPQTIAAGIPMYYLAASVLLLGLAFIGRRRQIGG